MNGITAQRILRWACLWSFMGVLPARPSHAQVQAFDFEKANLPAIVVQLHKAAALDAAEIRTAEVTPSRTSSRQAPGHDSMRDRDIVFRIGDRLFIDGYGATVIGVDSNGDLPVKLDGRGGYHKRTGTVKSHTVARTTGCSYGFCIGDRIITKDGDAGIVKGFFHHRTMLLSLDGYFGYQSRHVDLAEIRAAEVTPSRTSSRQAPGHDSMRDRDIAFGIGDRVFIDGYGATVIGVDSNDDLSMKLDGRGGYHKRTGTVKSHTVARTTGCSYGFCIGDAIITKDGDAGIVKGFFRRGAMLLSLDGYSGYQMRHVDLHAIARR